MGAIAAAAEAVAFGLFASAFFVGCAAAPSPRSDATFSFSRLPDLPDAHGFAGAYAGVSNGALIVAGGANFPKGAPWAGGTKVWHDVGFVLPKDASEWKRFDGVLASPRGYGASIPTPHGVLCIGGSDATRHFADVFLLVWTGEKMTRSELPPLPQPLANIAASSIGATVYVAGGIETPTSTSASGTFLSIDLSQREPTWRELPTWPGPPRMLFVAATADGAFFLVSGATLAPDTAGKPVRTYLTDAYRYEPTTGWRRIADVPHAVVAAPSPAIPTDNGFAILGGDDGTLVNFEPRDRHPGFNQTILRYDAVRDAWTNVGRVPLAQVTTTVVPFNGTFVIPTGEIRPAVRTPQVHVVTPEAAR